MSTTETPISYYRIEMAGTTSVPGTNRNDTNHPGAHQAEKIRQETQDKVMVPGPEAETDRTKTIGIDLKGKVTIANQKTTTEIEARVTTQTIDIEGTTEAKAADRSAGQTNTTGAIAEAGPTRVVTTATKTEKGVPAAAKTIRETEHASTNQMTETSNKAKTEKGTGAKTRQIIAQPAHIH